MVLAAQRTGMTDRVRRRVVGTLLAAGGAGGFLLAGD